VSFADQAGASGREPGRSARWGFDHLLLGLLAALSAALGLLWGTSVPFNEGPDEAAHFHIARFIAQQGRLPVFAPDELWLYNTEVGAVESYATFPPLAYIIQAGLLRLFGDTFWSARSLSLACYVATVGLTFLMARRLVPADRQVAVGAALAIALVPQVVFTGAYANTDAPALFLVAALCYVLVLLWERPHPAGFLLAGALVGVLLLTKYPAYAAAAVGCLAGLWLAGRSQSPHRCRALLLGATLGSSGWWFARNWQLYGEPIPGRVVAAAKEAAGGNSLVVAADEGVNLLTLSFATDFWPVTLKTLVGGFGFATVFLPTWMYALYAGLAVAGLIGGVALFASGSRTPARRAAIAIGGGVLTATIGSAMTVSVYGEWAAQGRYLFPALVPAAIGLAVGWRAIGERHGQLARLSWLPVAVMAGLNPLALWATAVPAYYGLGPQHIVLQVDTPSDERRLAQVGAEGRGVAIAGWSILEAASSWRPFAPEAVVGYRRAVDRVVVLLDGPPGSGIFVGQARYGLVREDVRDYYGGSDLVERVGFELVLPRERLSAGPRILWVCAYAAAEPEPACKTHPIEVL
jgi:hypothetical protein